jgi:hypothetical protein
MNAKASKPLDQVALFPLGPADSDMNPTKDFHLNLFPRNNREVTKLISSLGKVLISPVWASVIDERSGLGCQLNTLNIERMVRVIRVTITLLLGSRKEILSFNGMIVGNPKESVLTKGKDCPPFSGEPLMALNVKRSASFK